MVALRQLAVLEHLGLDNSHQKATEDHAHYQAAAGGCLLMMVVLWKNSS